MNQFEISYDDVVRLKHLRNVGEYVTGMVALQDCYEKSVGAQCEQLVSLIYLMTEQLDEVVQYCHDNLMNAEVA